MRIKINLSLDEETAAKLKDLAADRHTTVSQLITDWVWQKPENLSIDIDTAEMLQYIADQSGTDPRDLAYAIVKPFYRQTRQKETRNENQD